MAVTMQQVAELAGTSRATVSDVLRDRWRQKGISEHTCRRILDVVARTNYRPNRLACDLVRRRTRVIGVQVPSFLYDYCASIVRGLDAAARRLGYHVLLAAPTAWQNEAEELARLYEHQVDGLVLNPQVLPHMEKIINHLRSENVPMVFMGNPPREDDFMVTDDNVGQAAMAVEHLVRLGHTRIAHIAGPDGHLNAADRRNGYLQTLKHHNLPCPEGYIEVGNHSTDQAYVAMSIMLRLPSPPTAVYCGNDAMALGAIKAAEQAGLAVPRDLAVVGHGDDIPFSWFTRIPLTTIRQPAETNAERAMKMVIDLAEGRPVPQRRIALPGELIVRNSCGAKK